MGIWEQFFFYIAETNKALGTGMILKALDHMVLSLAQLPANARTKTSQAFG